MLEKVFKRMADPNDAELLSLHLQYLSKTLLDLFRQANPLAKLSDDSLTYQFLNITPETWNSHQDLAGCLEKLADPMLCKNLCLYLPELAVPDTPILAKLNELIETVRVYSFIHGIEHIHVLTPFLSEGALLTLSSLQTFDKVKFYALYLTNHYLIPKFLTLASNPDVIEAKIREFNKHGTHQDYITNSFKSFYDIEYFKY